MTFPWKKHEFCIDGCDFSAAATVGGAATPHLAACLSGSPATCSGGRGGFWLCDIQCEYWDFTNTGGNIMGYKYG